MSKTALIFWGGWEGHTPARSAGIVKEILTGHGFDVRLEQGTAALADPQIARLDLIVPVITMSAIEKPELENLVAAVRGGTGLAGFHGTMGDSFRNEPEYQFMTGGQWVSHPGGIIDYRIDIAKPDDPIVASIGSFAYRSEQYYLHVDPSNEVLATTTFDGAHFDGIKGVVMPVVWKRHYGKGRVFYSALGHTAEEFDVPQMKTIFERGALWAGRDERPSGKA
ncbi:ThuA domain-containing protein [Pararhizobium sp. YC-54]|uniref:ThuA domain-containing protein n=1 Tax=Pararhizobium sp. YC-54 TaxID=2986920 RepID=UPI0021F70C9A|nr:ThuA domain-containing protein [Pararhizobium sp. YC-54]MCV9998824.1 ThuA domain-containing protein [Pararhizobium sp. YC-54]